MKKLPLVLLIFVLLTIPIASLAASDSAVGKAIQATFPLFIDGERSPKDVIVVDGTSYLPVRAAGEMFGYEVSFDEANRYVVLNKQSAEEGEAGMTTTNQTDNQTEERVTEKYYYDSEVVDIWYKDDEKEKLPFLIWDGNVYVPSQIFNHYRTAQNEQVYPNGNSVTMNFDNGYAYEKDKDFFALSGKSMIKLSLTGYNYEIIGDTVWIVE